MHSIHESVRDDGELDSCKVLQREVLYIGSNGRAIERFYTHAAKSYIFKPLTNESQLGHEVWVYENLLPSLPDMYPKLLAYSSSPEPDQYWMIFEDLGQLSHDFEPSAMLELATLIEEWHAMPADKLQGLSIKAHKPFFEALIEKITSDTAEFRMLLSQLHVPEQAYTTLCARLANHRFAFSEKVVSHGDLHMGNYAKMNGKIMTLDWEHTHLNSRMWDLYHVIDMSHPLFPKSMTPSFRLEVLNSYLNRLAARKNFELDREAFLQEYYLFSAAFSLWMLGLIQKDLDHPHRKWPTDQLENQLAETLQTFAQCVQEL